MSTVHVAPLSEVDRMSDGHDDGLFSRVIGIVGHPTTPEVSRSECASWGCRGATPMGGLSRRTAGVRRTCTIEGYATGSERMGNRAITGQGFAPQYTSGRLEMGL